jgi:hypothetical protein
MYDGEDDDAKRLCGLIDPAELDNTLAYDSRKSGAGEGKTAPSQPQVTLKSVPSQAVQMQAAQYLQADLPEIAQTVHIRGNSKSSSLVAVA